MSFRSRLESGGHVSLFWRIFTLNAAVLIAAVCLLLFGPVTVSTPVLPAEALILLGGLTVMLIANAVLLRVGLAPLERLIRAMTTIDLLRPDPRPEVAGPAGIADLFTAFNTMLDRLESERATSNARALSAQESERHRVAQELHDEVGQTLTAVLLELKRVGDQVPEPLRADFRDVQEITRDSLDEIRRIARRLRPGVLEELGLVSALKSLAADAGGRAGFTVSRKFDPELPELGSEAELVLYRVAQESLTNIARHARAKSVEILLTRSADGGVQLRIIDDGIGVGGAAEGAGIRGMRERALLVSSHLTVQSGPFQGTEVRLHIPGSAA